jgi:galactokinase
MMYDALQQQFQALYQQPAHGIASAPGRVNLIGEFTDYNQGFVFPCSLGFRTEVLFRPRTDSKLVVHSVNYPGEHDSFALDQPIVEGPSQWGNYIRAMAFVLKRAGHVLQGADLLISSNVPQGAGLSSSAALEVAIGGVFNQINALNLSKQQIALFGQQAENDFMDCQCGIMDQLISAKGEQGHALLIDCRNLQTTAVPVPDDLTIVIINSNYPRKLVDSEYNQRRIDCEQAAQKMGLTSLRDATMSLLQQHQNEMSRTEYQRAHHVISENSRVLATQQALAANDMAALSALMQASHQSLRDDFEVTVPATDGLVEICSQALGSEIAVRMTGGGFGGAIVCLCREYQVATIRAAVKATYQARFGLQADIYVCNAGSGLQIELFTA